MAAAQAVKIGMNRDVSASVLKNVAELQAGSRNPKLQGHTYEILTQLVLMKTTCNSEETNAALQSTVRVTLQDLECEALVLPALGYLGALIQVISLPADEQIKVIAALTTKLKVVKEKNESRKLMWSLANIPLKTSIPLTSLEEMLQVALLFLAENPPVTSLSTVCESLNTLINIGSHQKEFFEANLTRIFPIAFPWLFYETDRIRELALQCLESFSSVIASQKLINGSIQAALKNTYYVFLKKLVSSDSVECLKIWGFIVQCFGTDLHESVSLLNELLKIEESALKSKNAAFRQVALEHWRYLIDCFALNPVVLNNSKRIKLMLVPLKSTDTKTIQISKTKIELWWYVLNKLGPDAATRFQEVVLPLLTFCYGSKDGKGQALVFTEISPLASTVLAGILSKETTFHSDPSIAGVSLSRSFPFLDQKNFDSSVDHFLFFCELLFDLEKIDENIGIYSNIWKSFMERCSSPVHFKSLKSFVGKILALVTTKGSLMELVLDSVVGAFDNDKLIEVLLENVNYLIKWFVENEPLPTHPLSKFLAKLFNRAVVWDVTKFSTEICKGIASNDAKDCLSTVADLWSKYAAALVNNSSNIQLKMVDQQFILFPLSWNLETTGLVPIWPSLVACWAKADASIIDKILNPKELKEEVDVELSIARFVLKALSSELILESTRISAWVQQWTKSWMERASLSDRDKCRDLLVDLILCIHLDVANKPASELLVSEMRSCLNSPSQEVTEILRSIFGPVSTAAKSANVVKLRQCADVCKSFSALLPAAARNTRARTKTKDDDDDFVVVPPKEKANQVLTEHQKEVRRSRKRSSNVPALYSDLSQSSQQTESQLPESLPSDSVPLPPKQLMVLSCSSSIDADEDAMMEPPISINAESEPAPPSVQTDEIMTIDTEEQETQKETRLRSRKSVPVQRVTRRSTGQLPIESSKESSTDEDPKSPPIVEYRRPCPASKKPKIGPLSRTRRSTGTAIPVVTEEIVESTVHTADPLALTTRDYSDKENGGGTGLPAVPALLATLASNAISPRRVSFTTLRPVIEKQMEPVVSAPVTDSEKIPDQLTPADKSIHELETPASSPTTTSQPEIEAMDTLPPPMEETIEPAKKGENGESDIANEETVPETENSEPVSSNAVDDLNDEEAQQQNLEKPDVSQDSGVKFERLLVKPVPFSYSNRMRTFPSSRSKNQTSVRSRPGPASCTGGRAAQILELSRKKVNKDDASPRQDTEDKTMDIGQVVMTPEGSPARTKPWVPRTYSPFASPSTAGILKKRPRGGDEEAEEGSGDGSPVSSACKSRRVSFADPAVSHLAKISPMPVRLSTGRTRRSLISTYEKPSGSSEAEAQDTSSIQETPPNSIIMTSSHKDIMIGSATSTTSATEDDQTVKINEDDDCSPLYPEKVDCTDAISVIIDQLAIPGGSVAEVFQERGITLIGNLCALPKGQVRELDIQAIHYPSVREALVSYFSSSVAAVATSQVTPTVSDVVSNDSVPADDTIPSDPTESGEASGSSSQSAPIDDQDTEMTESSSSEPPIADPREAFLLLSADEVISLIAKHPSKLEIISNLTKRYVKITVMDTVI